MARSAALIQAEIDALEAAIPSIIRAASYSVNGRAKANQRLKEIADRLDMLYQMLDRVNGTSPMLVRGVVKGL